MTSCCVSESLDELRLVADILDTLSNTEHRLRADEVIPLTNRIRRAVETVAKSYIENKTQAPKESGEKDRCRRADGFPDLSQQARQPQDQQRMNVAKKQVVKKPSSVSAFPVPREQLPRGQLAVSKEVSRCLACSLYNILEGATRLLKASFSHIFVRKKDEMVSIANCAAKLAFPPQLVRHRCLGSLDAEVLASGIAVNQQFKDASRITSSLLIFPVFPNDPPSSSAVAVIHVENKCQGALAFNEADEGVLLTTTQLIGGLMSRFPQMDWVTSFYDPVTQHILAPFEPRKKLPLFRGGVTRDQAFITENGVDADFLSEASCWKKIEDFEHPLLIRREVLPRLAVQKNLAQGLSAVPTLREVDAYVENMHSCWKHSVSGYIALSEEQCSNKIELKIMKRELTLLKGLYAEAEEKLRLYRLQGRDYEDEYRNIKGELDAYVRRRDKMDDV